jgi:hypothetical protein
VKLGAGRVSENRGRWLVRLRHLFGMRQVCVFVDIAGIRKDSVKTPNALSIRVPHIYRRGRLFTRPAPAIFRSNLSLTQSTGVYLVNNPTTPLPVPHFLRPWRTWSSSSAPAVSPHIYRAPRPTHRRRFGRQQGAWCSSPTTNGGSSV